MKRRNFIQNVAAASASVPLLLNACTPVKKEEENESTANSNIEDFALTEITTVALQEKMKSGELTSRSITEMYLKRIDTIDKNGPKLNSVIEINPDALSIADALDAERKGGKIRGPLHGVPVLIKDNIDTADKMTNSAGSIAMEGNLPTIDSFIVKKLRDAGAVILGKTNLSEWANFRSTHSVSGWSSRGGQAKNLYALDRNTSGSSSGSGAAVAANLCAVAIGTETDGSIVSPASTNGIVGIKPTVGLWSRSGIIPISSTQDTPGPMTRTVKDAAILLGASIGIDENDSATKTQQGKTSNDYTIFLDTNALKGKRLGFEKSFLKGNENIVALANQAIEILKAQGAEVIEVELLAALKETGRKEFDVLLYEFKDGLNKYLSNANGKVKSLKELIEFNKQNSAKTMPYFKQEILEQSEEKGDLNSKEYKEALAASTPATQKVIDKIMEDQKLDAICGTTSGLAWCIDWANGDYDTGFSFSSPAAVAGYPHITVPMGSVLGLPIGLSFFSKAYSEGVLIGFAYAYEQASKKRVIPKFLKSILD
ncbi:MAG: amidase [Cyclobacteriaceae bacterium]